jgi:hypothetical protein
MICRSNLLDKSSSELDESHELCGIIRGTTKRVEVIREFQYVLIPELPISRLPLSLASRSNSTSANNAWRIAYMSKIRTVIFLRQSERIDCMPNLASRTEAAIPGLN